MPWNLFSKTNKSVAPNNVPIPDPTYHQLEIYKQIIDGNTHIDKPFPENKDNLHDWNFADTENLNGDHALVMFETLDKNHSSVMYDTIDDLNVGFSPHEKVILRGVVAATTKIAEITVDTCCGIAHTSPYCNTEALEYFAQCDQTKQAKLKAEARNRYKRIVYDTQIICFLDTRRVRLMKELHRIQANHAFQELKTSYNKTPTDAQIETRIEQYQADPSQKFVFDAYKWLVKLAPGYDIPMIWQKQIKHTKNHYGFYKTTMCIDDHFFTPFNQKHNYVDEIYRMLDLRLCEFDPPYIPIGCIFDLVATQNPQIWAYKAPEQTFQDSAEKSL